MAQPKTTRNKASAKGFLAAIEDRRIREDCRQIASLMEAAAKAAPTMWGTAIVGFGTRSVKYADGSEREWMLIGFSPRKRAITLYLGADIPGRKDLVAQLGDVSDGGSCLYIKRLSDTHLPTLKKLIKASVAKRG